MLALSCERDNFTRGMGCDWGRLGSKYITSRSARETSYGIHFVKHPNVQPRCMDVLFSQAQELKGRNKPTNQSPYHKASLCPTTKPHVLLSCTSAAKPCCVQLFWELEQKAEPYLLATKINTSAIVHEGFPAGERLCCLCTCCGFPYMWKELAGWLQGIGYSAEVPQRNEIFESRLGFMGGSVQQKRVCNAHPSPLIHASDL